MGYITVGPYATTINTNTVTTFYDGYIFIILIKYESSKFFYKSYQKLHYYINV